jgi:hypothetical protein
MGRAVKDNTVEIFVEWFRIQGCTIEADTVLVGPDGRLLDLVSLANFLEIKEKRGLRFSSPQS